MRAVKSAYGEIYKGQDFSNVPDIVVPDQSLSLQEILDRFTRNESLPVDMGGEFGSEDFDNSLNIDLEKMARADLTEKAEYYNALEELKKKFKAQESEAEKRQRAAKEKADKDQLEAEIRAKIASEKTSA